MSGVSEEELKPADGDAAEDEGEVQQRLPQPMQLQVQQQPQLAQLQLAQAQAQLVLQQQLQAQQAHLAQAQAQQQLQEGEEVEWASPYTPAFTRAVTSMVQQCVASHKLEAKHADKIWPKLAAQVLAKEESKFEERRQMGQPKSIMRKGVEFKVKDFVDAYVAKFLFSLSTAAAFGTPDATCRRCRVSRKPTAGITCCPRTVALGGSTSPIRKEYGAPSFARSAMAEFNFSPTHIAVEDLSSPQFF
eukprot:jgi/Mesen1/9242/ME000006S09242